YIRHRRDDHGVALVAGLRTDTRLDGHDPVCHEVHARRAQPSLGREQLLCIQDGHGFALRAGARGALPCIGNSYDYTLAARQAGRPRAPAMSTDTPSGEPLQERVWRNARLACMVRGAADIGLIARGAILVRGERIAFAGDERDLPPGGPASRESIDCEGRLITPGLIDCHTHLIHAGHRAHEFEQRLRGVSYQEIAETGGGILST